MATKTWSASASQSWSVATWSPTGVPVAGDDVVLSPSATATLTLNENTAALNSLTVGTASATLALATFTLNVGAGGINVNAGAVTLAGGAIADAAGAITLASGATVSGHGTISAASLTNAGAITASGGTLTVNGALNSASGSVGTLTAGATGSAGILVLNDASYANALTFAGTTGSAGSKLEIGSGALATITGGPTAIGAYNLQLLGAGAGFANASGVSLSTGIISGQGTFNAAISATGAANLNANGGGALELAQQVSGAQITLTIGASSADTLLLDVAGNSVASVGFSSATGAGTLELASGATLTATNAIALGSNTIKLDSATSSLTDNSGVTVTTGAISGQGLVAAAVTATGAAKITESGGVLEINGKVSGGTTTLSIGATAADRLLLDAAGDAVTTATFASATGAGTLEIGATGSLTVAGALAVGANNVTLDNSSSGVQLTDTANSITLAGGTLGGTGTVAAANAISGYGTLAIPLTTGAGTITANGGSAAGETTLDLTGSVSGRALAIGTTNASDLKIDGTATSAAISITNAKQTLEIGASPASLTLTASEDVYGGKIVLDGGTLTDLSEIQLGQTGGSGVGALSGSGLVNAVIGKLGSQTTNSITASGGTLEIDGAIGSVGAGVDSLVVGSGATDELLLDGASYATAASFAGSTGTLAINVAAALTLNNTLAVGANIVALKGAGVQLTDAGGLTLAGGSITGAGTIGPSNAISGWGTVAIPLGVSAITANGDGVGDTTLDLTGSVSGASLSIGSTNASDLKIDGSTSAVSIAVSSANQTLEIGATGALTLTAAESIAGGRIQLDGGALSDSSGLAVVGGATLEGSGTIGAPISGNGTIGANVSGGTLELQDGLTGATGLSIGAASGMGATLKLDGASAATIANFTGTRGTLEIGASGSLTLSSAFNLGSGAVQLDGAASQFTDANGVSLANGTISGIGVIDAAVTATENSGFIYENSGASGPGGTLTFDGDIGVSGAGVNGLSLFTGSLAGDVMQLDGASNVVNMVYDQGSGTVMLASGATLTVNSQVQINGSLDLAGSGTQLTANGPGLFLYAGGDIYGSGAISAAAMGAYTNGAPYNSSAVDHVATTVVGQLEIGLNTQFTQNVTAGSLKLDGTPYTVEFDGASNQIGSLIALGTIEIGSGGALTATQQWSLGGAVTLDLAGSGVQFTDASGLVLAAGTLAGTGAVNASTAISGRGKISAALDGGSVTASGGLLTVSGNIDATAATSFTIDQTAHSDLLFSGQTGSAMVAPTIAFGALAATDWGTLDLTGEGTGSTFTSNFHAVISGFGGTGATAATSAVIDVAGSGGADHVVWTQGGASGTLQVENASNIVLESLTLDGAYVQSQFVLTTVGSVDQISANAVEVSTFLLDQSSLDAVAGGFAIVDSASNVSGAFDALNGDAHIDAITLTDAAPVLTLTLARALNDTAAFHAITNASYRIDLVDTQADYTALTFAQKTALNALIATGRVISWTRTNIPGQNYTSTITNYDALGDKASIEYDGVTGAPYYAFRNYFSGSNTSGYTSTGLDLFYSNQAAGLTEVDLDGSGALIRALYAYAGTTPGSETGVEVDYVAGETAGAIATYLAPANATYSTFAVEYANNYQYDGAVYTFYYTGQIYNEAQYSYTAGAQPQLAEATFSQYAGAGGPDVASFFYDGSGALAASQYAYSGVTGQLYTSDAFLYNAANVLIGAQYGGYTSKPFSSQTTFYDANGAATEVVRDFTSPASTGSINGQAYNAYEKILNPAFALLATAYHLDNGGNVYVGVASNVSSPSFGGTGVSANTAELSNTLVGGDWTITGGGTGETFNFASFFNKAEITDYGAAFGGATDVVSVSTQDFADWATMLGDAAASGSDANTTFTSTTTGDKLTLDGVTVAQLTALTTNQASADFLFHS